MYICDFSRSVGAGSAATRKMRGLTRSVMALIVPPLPAPSRPSKRMQTFFVRQLPSVACGKAAPSEPAHVRTGTDGGVGMKPGDRYAVPLCANCHARQHRVGELTFWSALRFDPLNVALRLWTVSADLTAGERIVSRATTHRPGKTIGLSAAIVLA